MGDVGATRLCQWPREIRDHFWPIRCPIPCGTCPALPSGAPGGRGHRPDLKGYCPCPLLTARVASGPRHGTGVRTPLMGVRSFLLRPDVQLTKKSPPRERDPQRGMWMETSRGRSLADRSRVSAARFDSRRGRLQSDILSLDDDHRIWSRPTIGADASGSSG